MAPRAVGEPLHPCAQPRSKRLTPVTATYYQGAEHHQKEVHKVSSGVLPSMEGPGEIWGLGTRGFAYLFISPVYDHPKDFLIVPAGNTPVQIRDIPKFVPKASS